MSNNKRTITTAFYDVMFAGRPSSGALNTLEQDVLDKVRGVLNDPAKLHLHIPPLPALVMRLIELTRDEHADFAKLAMVIEQDPSLYGRVLQRANSPAYFRGDKKIGSLEKAVSLMGLSGVSSIASAIIMEKIRPANPIYYKMFGKLIWDHSLQTAYVCRDFATQQHLDEFDGYFLGLIHDVGKIVIFNCLCQSLSSCMDDEMPNSHIFKSLMSEMSVDISTAIAEEWQLPETFISALAQQRSGSFSPLGEALFRANLLTEIYLLHSKNQITEVMYQQIFEKRKIDLDYADGFFAAAPNLTA